MIHRSADAEATLKDVAKLAGVSMKTVSRVVNRERNVSASTRERVVNAIDALNYRPNEFARYLASQRSQVRTKSYSSS